MSQIKFVENIKTHFVFNNSPPPENRAVFEKMWKNIVDPDSRRMAIWRIRITCWMTKATDTLSICNTVFPLQQCYPRSTNAPHC